MDIYKLTFLFADFYISKKIVLVAKLGPWLHRGTEEIKVFIKFIVYTGPLLILTICVLRLRDLHARVPPSGFSAGTEIVETGLRRSENSPRTRA